MIRGYHYFWKHPYHNQLILPFRIQMGWRLRWTNCRLSGNKFHGKICQFRSQRFCVFGRLRLLFLFNLIGSDVAGEIHGLSSSGWWISWNNLLSGSNNVHLLKVHNPPSKTSWRCWLFNYPPFKKKHNIVDGSEIPFPTTLTCIKPTIHNT